MEKQELKSKWDELARELGAEIPPEIEQREEAVSMTEPPVPPRQEEAPAATVRPPLPKRAAGWESLAGELGLPAVEPPARPDEIRPPAKRCEPVQQREPVQQPAARRPEQRERSDRSRPTGQQRERTEQRREPGAKRRETREPAEKRRERPTHDTDVPAETQGPQAPRAESQPPEPPSPRDEPQKPSATVSLWHKIFGSPAEQSAKLTDPSTADRPEPSLSTEAREERPSSPRTTEIRSLSGEDVTAAGFVEELERGDESTSPSGDDRSTERKLDRPRRRRRGGRGRKSDQRPAEDRPPARQQNRLARAQKEVEIDDDLTDSDLEDEFLGPDDRLDDTDLDEADDSDEAGSNKSRASQRAIPSWDEAIGYIVDSNMQSRSQRRPPSRSDSRGNSSRGRSRGRRKS
jgi:hypothetical protein